MCTLCRWPSGEPIWILSHLRTALSKLIEQTVINTLWIAQSHQSSQWSVCICLRAISVLSVHKHLSRQHLSTLNACHRKKINIYNIWIFCCVYTIHFWLCLAFKLCIVPLFSLCIQSMQQKQKKSTFWAILAVYCLIWLDIKITAACICWNLLSVLFYSMTLLSCWMGAGLLPKSTGRWVNQTRELGSIIRSPSTKRDSSSTWTQGCGTLPFIMTGEAWKSSPTTPSSRVRGRASATGWLMSVIGRLRNDMFGRL